MNVELKGTLVVIGSEEKISDQLKIKEIVVRIDEDTQYPQDISCRSINQNISSLDNFKVDDKVVVTCNLRGRESKGKYYNQLVIWNIKQQ